MISISTIFTTVKHNDKDKVDNNDYYYYVEEGELITQSDIDKVDAEIIQELKELFDDDEMEKEL
jgi:hypothetical protein